MNKIQEIDQEITYWYRERLKLLHPLRQLFWTCMVVLLMIYMTLNRGGLKYHLKS